MKVKDSISDIPKEKMVVVREVLHDLEKAGVPMQKLTTGELVKRIDTNMSVSDRKYVVDAVSKYHSVDEGDTFDEWLSKTNITPGQNVALSQARYWMETLLDDCYNYLKAKRCREIGISVTVFDELKHDDGAYINLNGDGEELASVIDEDLWRLANAIFQENFKPQVFFNTFMRGATSIKGFSRLDFKEEIIGRRILDPDREDKQRGTKEKVKEAVE